MSKYIYNAHPFRDWLSNCWADRPRRDDLDVKIYKPTEIGRIFNQLIAHIQRDKITELEFSLDTKYIAERGTLLNIKMPRRTVSIPLDGYLLPD